MNIGGLFGALTPVFFVLALGYLAGKRNTFDADQSAGLSKLALTFALPASLFVSMTDIPKDLLLQQGRLVLALILSHAGLFVVAWLLLRMVKSLSGTASIIYALMLATSATPVFGLAVLEPLLRRTSGGAMGQRSISRHHGSFETERHRNGIECRREITTPMGADPRNLCCPFEHSPASRGS
jgi:malonate transporter